VNHPLIDFDFHLFVYYYCYYFETKNVLVLHLPDLRKLVDVKGAICVEEFGIVVVVVVVDVVVDVVDIDD